MSKKWFVLAFVIVLSLSDCSRNTTETQSVETQTMETSTVGGFLNEVYYKDIPNQNEEEFALAEADFEPIISIVKAPDSITGDYFFFEDDRTNERIILSTRENLENFAYIDIVPVFTDDGLFFHPGEQLFSIDPFTPEKPLVVSVNIGSGIPAKGIHFEHNGTIWYFYITESGMDGSLMFVEFMPYFG